MTEVVRQSRGVWRWTGLKRRPRLALVLVALLVCVSSGPRLDVRAQTVPTTLPASLSDEAFWKMIEDFSEPTGLFPSDNFVSNEVAYQEVIPQLKKLASPEGVYLGVGPDQNFTYIAALEPRMAFIIDIRRQNLIQHLLYKAIIEMSADRADFLALLFSRPRPAGLEESSPPAALFDAFRTVAADEHLFREHLAFVKSQLVDRHGFGLSQDDLRSLEYVYTAFFADGPDLRYSFPRRRSAPWFPTYASLQTMSDRTGRNHSYLASEQSYRTLREFERRNLLIPIVGDFGGEKAIRAVGRYLAVHGATVNYFYTSNVEQYLFHGDAWRQYYASVASLPLNNRSAFIRAYFNTGYVYPPGIVMPNLGSVQLVDPVLSFLNAFGGGMVHSYVDVVGRIN